MYKRQATNRLLANTSPLGMRKSLAALSKNILIFSDYISLLIIHFVVELIALVYLTLLGVDFGNKYPAILLTPVSYTHLQNMQDIVLSCEWYVIPRYILFLPAQYQAFHAALPV